MRIHEIISKGLNTKVDSEVLLNNIALSDFPTTRYQGSKRKILPWIWSIVRDIPFNTVLDSFGGTGSVSYLFKKMGKAVVYNDNLKFNYLIGKALIENNHVKLNNQEIEWLLQRHDDVEYATFIQDHFNGEYFLSEENEWLDMLSSNIKQMKDDDKERLKYKKAVAYYALFQASLIKRPFNLFHRKNLSLRTRSVVRTFGNKTTWDKPFEELFCRFSIEASKMVFDSAAKCIALNESIIDIAPGGFDLVYFDPPYFRINSSNETSDYSKCYHFLEGLADYPNWASHLQYRRDNLNSTITASSISNVLEKLISRFSKSTIVLSYKWGGVPSIGELIRLMKRYKRVVKVYSKHYKYALNHQNGDARKNRECLILGL